MNEHRSVKEEVADPVIEQLKALLPDSLPNRAAWKKNLDRIRDVIYDLYSEAYEGGDADGYDRGYDDGYESGYENGQVD